MNSSTSHFPKEEWNKLFVLINNRDWNRVITLAKRSPNLAKEHYTITSFYDGRISSCMAAIHLACSLAAPASVLQALHVAHPGGVEEMDSCYARLPLHIAALFGMANTDIIVLLKMSERALKTQDAHGRIPLHYACKSNSTPNDEKNALTFIKAFPESVHVADFNSFLPIHVSCRNCNPRTVIRMLIRSAPETIVKQTAKGNTAIGCAKNSRHGDAAQRQEIVGILERTVEEFGLLLPSES
jgi:hypothetical protein